MTPTGPTSDIEMEAPSKVLDGPNVIYTLETIGGHKAGCKSYLLE